MHEIVCNSNALTGIRAVGAGLKPEHAADIFDGARRVDFFEIHAENYMGAGGPPHHLLRRIRADYPLSIHGVGLSIGGAGAARSRASSAIVCALFWPINRPCSPNIWPGRRMTASF